MEQEEKKCFQKKQTQIEPKLELKNKAKSNVTKTLCKRGDRKAELPLLTLEESPFDQMELPLRLTLKQERVSANSPYSLSEFQHLPNVRVVLTGFFVEGRPEHYRECSHFEKKCITLILRKKLENKASNWLGKGQNEDKIEELSRPFDASFVEELAAQSSTYRNFDMNLFVVKLFIDFELCKYDNRMAKNIDLTKRENHHFKLRFFEASFPKKSRTQLGAETVFSTFTKISRASLTPGNDTFRGFPRVALRTTSTKARLS